jgi:hypothetical protein
MDDFNLKDQGMAVDDSLHSVDRDQEGEIAKSHSVICETGFEYSQRQRDSGMRERVLWN